MNLETELLNFFVWFRDNGTKYIGLSIESMIKIYIDETFVSN